MEKAMKWGNKKLKTTLYVEMIEQNNELKTLAHERKKEREIE